MRNSRRDFIKKQPSAMPGLTSGGPGISAKSHGRFMGADSRVQSCQRQHQGNCLAENRTTTVFDREKRQVLAECNIFKS